MTSNRFSKSRASPSIQVVNLRDVHIWTEAHLYIGRGTKEHQPSLLGNPYVIGRDGDREQVILRYRYWLWREIKHQGAVWMYLQQLHERRKRGDALILVCHCAPLACHGDVVQRCLLWLEATSVS